MTKNVLLVASISVSLLAGCGQAAQDLSFTNPEWRSSVNRAVSFPLAEELTLRVGLAAGMTAPAEDSVVRVWLEKKTNIKLRFVSLTGGGEAVAAGQPGAMELGQVADVELGELIRAGKLPDIVPESRMDLREESLRSLFVDMLEFPELTPSFRQAAAALPRFRDGLLARLSEGDRLYSLGTYEPDRVPFAGVLAYRQDVFGAQGLATESWESIGRSLKALKTTYPESRPFGGLFATIMTMMPSWFGSGYSASDIVYFDNDTGQWRFGPYEAPFEDMVRFLAGLYQQGILSPDMVVTREDNTVADFSNNRAFMAPYRGATGPYFGFVGDYGALTPEGVWNGRGAWVSSLPLPPPPRGGTPKGSTQRFSPVTDGWLVYNQSKHAGEAIAMLDLLFTEEASRISALGPEGTVWRASGSKIELLEPYGQIYRDGGVPPLSEKMTANGIATGFPLQGLVFGFSGAFGPPQSPQFRYLLQKDLAVNRLGTDLYAETGLRIPYQDRTFNEQRANAVANLQTHIESAVANFILGQRGLSEYGVFKEELGKMGADQLLELFRQRAVPGDPAVFAQE